MYNRVIVRWTTHNPKGLSDKDVEMARFCDAKALEVEGSVKMGRDGDGDGAGGRGVKAEDTVLGGMIRGGEECAPCARASK